MLESIASGLAWAVVIVFLVFVLLLILTFTVWILSELVKILTDLYHRR